MMAAETRSTDLLDRLPAVRGRYQANAALDRITWFRVGGPAEVMYRPADRDDLMAFLANTPDDVPVTVIGVGSNLLVRDGGIPGVVIRLGRAFAEVTTAEDHVRAGAATLDINVALAAREANLGGLEFLFGVPGTIGGALRMNAGAYGRELKDVLRSAEVLDPKGTLYEMDAAALGLSYRHCAVADDWIFAGAVLNAAPDDPGAISRRMREISQSRETSQPLRTRTGGSTFKNPEGQRAWELIDKAGCRGLRLGGAVVSEKHCNFLINTGTASAAELEALGEEVRRRVREATGVTLEWEIRRIGLPGQPARGTAAFVEGGAA
jgi:UDP-N-acetylmuramate dehydrogenase